MLEFHNSLIFTVSIIPHHFWVWYLGKSQSRLWVVPENEATPSFLSPLGSTQWILKNASSGASKINTMMNHDHQRQPWYFRIRAVASNTRFPRNQNIATSLQSRWSSHTQILDIISHRIGFVSRSSPIDYLRPIIITKSIEIHRCFDLR